MSTIAVIADTHGNATAFEAVLADAYARGAERILHLGDVAGKGPRGARCCELAREHCEVTVLGNWDTAMAHPEKFEHLQWWRTELGQENQTWLAHLPLAVDLLVGGKAIRCYHASADSEFHRIFPHQLDAELEGMFANTDRTGDGPTPDVVIYGDIHFAYATQIGDRLVINAGSVGNPLDEPTASYLLLDDANGFSYQHVRVPYDIEAELAIAETAGMPSFDLYATELRTAIYAGRR